MAGVFTWIRQWRAGNGAGPGAAAPETAGEPSEPGGAEIPGGPVSALEPIRPTAVVPAGGDVRPPRDVLPERPPTDNDVKIFLMYAVLGSDQGQKRFIKVLAGAAVILVALCVAVPLAAFGAHALIQEIAPGSAPSLGTMMWSASGFAGVAALVWGRRRIRAQPENRSQTPPTPEPEAAPPAEESAEPQP
ncbi:hypothetical protein ACIRU3_34300 [Streptomyces sp. NPDC101151]|uniref:hypothetical protein n=1 Tax=Streptomyces sp. NPDC101151 TaxID=3366115 RepID=UPI0038167DF8